MIVYAKRIKENEIRKKELGAKMKQYEYVFFAGLLIFFTLFQHYFVELLSIKKFTGTHSLFQRILWYKF